MSATVRVSIPQLAEWFRKVGPKAHSAIRVGLANAATAAIPIMHDATQNAPPASPFSAAGAGAFGGAVATGKYLRAWKSARITKFGSYGIRVYNLQAPYNAVIEYGRRAGKRPPPIAPLTAWAQLKMGLPYRQARRVAFAISKSIGQRGLRPRHVLTSDSTLQRLGNVLRVEVLRAMVAALGAP